MVTGIRERAVEGAPRASCMRHRPHQWRWKGALARGPRGRNGAAGSGLELRVASGPGRQSR